MRKPEWRSTDGGVAMEAWINRKLDERIQASFPPPTKQLLEETLAFMASPEGQTIGTKERDEALRLEIDRVKKKRDFARLESILADPAGRRAYIEILQRSAGAPKGGKGEQFRPHAHWLVEQVNLIFAEEYEGRKNRGRGNPPYAHDIVFRRLRDIFEPDISISRRGLGFPDAKEGD